MVINVDIVLLVIGLFILLLRFVRFVVGGCLLSAVFISVSCARPTCAMWGPWAGVIMVALYC